MRNNVGGVVTTQLMNLGKNLYSKGLDRAGEFEADALGVSLATRAGMDPFGLPTVLQTLSTVRPDDPAYLLALAAHPPTRPPASGWRRCKRPWASSSTAMGPPARCRCGQG